MLRLDYPRRYEDLAQVQQVVLAAADAAGTWRDAPRVDAPDASPVTASPA